MFLQRVFASTIPTVQMLTSQKTPANHLKKGTLQLCWSLSTGSVQIALLWHITVFLILPQENPTVFHSIYILPLFPTGANNTAILLAVTRLLHQYLNALCQSVRGTQGYSFPYIFSFECCFSCVSSDEGSEPPEAHSDCTSWSDQEGGLSPATPPQVPIVQRYSQCHQGLQDHSRPFSRRRRWALSTPALQGHPRGHHWGNVPWPYLVRLDLPDTGW